MIDDVVETITLLLVRFDGCDRLPVYQDVEGSPALMAVKLRVVAGGC